MSCRKHLWSTLWDWPASYMPQWNWEIMSPSGIKTLRPCRQSRPVGSSPQWVWKGMQVVLQSGKFSSSAEWLGYQVWELLQHETLSFCCLGRRWCCLCTLQKLQHSSVHDLNLEEGDTSARKMEVYAWRAWHLLLEKQWFFKAGAMAICGHVPASPGCYSLPFHFLQQLVSWPAEKQWKSWIQSAESGRRHSQHRRTQLETILVCICTRWRCCGEVRALYIWSIKPASS